MNGCIGKTDFLDIGHTYIFMRNVGKSHEETLTFIQEFIDKEYLVDSGSVERLIVPFGLCWGMNGFPIIEPSHKLASSFMSTNFSSDMAVDIKPPWNCYGVQIPKGLLKAETNDQMEPEFVLVAFSEDKITTLICWPGGLDKRTDDNIQKLINRTFEHRTLKNKNSEEQTEEMKNFEFFVENNVNELERKTLLIHKLILGCTLEIMTTPAYQNSQNIGAPAPRLKRGEPKCWTFRLTRAVQVDTREAIREYIRYGGNSPTVQSLVRGHYKNQPFGKGRQFRKWIHVEPYWRGPEDAPIAVRSHKL